MLRGGMWRSESISYKREEREREGEDFLKVGIFSSIILKGFVYFFFFFLLVVLYDGGLFFFFPYRPPAYFLKTYNSIF